MARLDVLKTIKESRKTGIKKGYGITAEELKIIKDASSGTYDFANNAFLLGYAQGYKEKTAESEQLISYAGIEEYRVQSFDTLSSIAVKYIPSDKYMSKWIEDVKRLNNRKSNDIYFDEVIRVYVYEK